MSNAGLSRRRVGGGGASSATSTTTNSPTRSNFDTLTPTVSASAPQPSSSSSPNGGSSHAGTALEGGSKVAYDPRDLMETEQGGGKMPLLTLLEEVLLLGLKDKQVRPIF